MSDWKDPLDHLRRIEISAADLDRWETVGQRLEHMAPELLLELVSLRANPTKHNLHIAASAAQLAAQIVDEPLKTEAIALAEELEQRSI
jgi:hypothetical protein